MSWVIERPDLDRVTQSAPRTRSSPRRTHTKSKNGCQACKKRRIKCDETSPACGQCRDKNTTCVYPNPRTQSSSNRDAGQTSASAAPATARLETSSSIESSETTSQPPAPAPIPQASPGAAPPQPPPGLLPTALPALNPPAPPPQQDPITDSSPMPLELAKARIMLHLELVNIPCTRDANFATSPYRRADVPELLDHFVATHFPWAGSPECQRVMQTWAPTLAVTNVFLMHGLLAFSASHLKLLKPWEPKYGIAASLHYGLSLSGFATSLGDSVGRANADALFACCYLHAMLAFHNKPSPLEPDTDPADFAWLRLMKGIPILQRTNVLRPHLNRSLWLPVFIESGAFSAESGPLPNPAQPLTAAMSSIESLRQACGISPHEAENEANPYATTLAHLDKLSRVDIDSTKIGALMVFVGRMPEEFVVLLEKLDKKSMLILAQWCEFAGNVEQWWCQRPAAEECRRLRKVVVEREGEGMQAFPITPESMG